MPFYEYQAKDETGGCPHCAQPFAVLQKISEPPLANCPQCGKPLIKLISAPNVGASKSSLDSRAKSAGFTKFQKLGKGEYEKKY